MSMLFVAGEYYPVKQENGQKIVGPCMNWQKFNRNPERSKEIFIHRIPHTMTELQLLRIYCNVGPIWKFRLMMNFSGQNRGFAYLQYIHEEHYYQAFQFLQGMQFQIEYKIYRVFMAHSLNICALQMGGLDHRLDPKLVVENIQNLVCSKEVKMYLDKNGEIVLDLQFFNHRDAALSKRTILSSLEAFGASAWVRWKRMENHADNGHSSCPVPFNRMIGSV